MVDECGEMIWEDEGLATGMRARERNIGLVNERINYRC